MSIFSFFLHDSFPCKVKKSQKKIVKAEEDKNTENQNLLSLTNPFNQEVFF